VATDLSSLRPGTPRKGKKRVGRGIGSGHGKTSGKGHKGQKARAGGVKGAGFEGGQLPLQRRLPQLFRFKNEPFRVTYEIVNVGDLARLPAGAEVTPALLAEHALVRRTPHAVKILGQGEVGAAVSVSAHAFSAEARRKIEAAGGKATVLGGGPGGPRPVSAP
jgi:large subunit ribosomal protein L15